MTSPPATVTVTPRFEIFYALQELAARRSASLQPWRRRIEAALSRGARSAIQSVAPSPLMWPLFADSLRDEAADLSYDAVIDALQRADPGTFQSAIAEGVFKSRETVQALAEGKLSLEGAIAGATSRHALLSLLGLHPFDKESAAARTFNRLIAEPAEFRDEVITALGHFWRAGFRDTWEILETQMHDSAEEMRAGIARRGLQSLGKAWKLPVAFDGGAVVSAGGATRLDFRAVRDIHFIPSVFNVTRLWASYADADGRARVFVPYLDLKLSPAVAEPGESASSRSRTRVVEPRVVFQVLGDTTRYAIATTLARSPMTSVELARLFKVSKPTISHHVQQLRAARLLIERDGQHGVILSLDRRTLEQASGAAAREMFSTEGPDHVVRRSRRKNTT